MHTDKKKMVQLYYLVPGCVTSMFKFIFINWSMLVWYTCQLFLKYRREIFILGVLGFLKMTRSFPNIPEEVRSLPKKSEVFRSRLSVMKAEKALAFFQSQS